MKIFLTSDPKLYLLRDQENERKYRTTLEQTIAKARQNRRQLFKNYQVYISSHLNSRNSLQQIVDTHGGEAKIVSNMIKPRARILRSDYLKPVDQVLICTTQEEDKALRMKFREEAKEVGYKWKIYVSDWIMGSVLRQEVADDEGAEILN